MPQNYEDYWKLTLEYTDFNNVSFLTTLRILVEKIDELNQNGEYIYRSRDYKDIQILVLQNVPKNSPNIENQLVSTRKAINQCVKLGFINPFFKSYHALTKDYLNANTNRKRKTIFSKIFYSNSKFNASITNDHNWSQINFLLKTLEEVGKLSSIDLIAIMTIDITTIENGYLNRESIDIVSNSLDPGFIERKYNQIAYLLNILQKLDDVVLKKNLEQNISYLLFDEDAKMIYGDTYRNQLNILERGRDPYLHRLYKKQLKIESELLFGAPKCFLENIEYPVLIASHIKPFILSDENEAYDPNNGLLLSETIDSLFDLRYISFNDDGSIIFSSQLADDVVNFWKNYNLDLGVLNPQRREYLSYHRSIIRN